MQYTDDDINLALKELFKKAESESPVDYIFTLVRVTGITKGLDPLLQLKIHIESDKQSLTERNMFSKYYIFLNAIEPFELLSNLINCLSKKSFEVSPFQHLYTGHFPNIEKPEAKKVVDEVIASLKRVKLNNIADFVRCSYPDASIEACSSDNDEAISRISNLDDLKVSYTNCHNFLSQLLNLYFSERIKYLEMPKFYKLPRFEVLELMNKEDLGLYGFKVHFSNGNSARFIRHNESTECVNVILDSPINFMVGLLDELKDEWRIGDKRLYEVGLPGRYNKLGEWKPLIYPGKSDQLQKEACNLSEDPNVQGILFYMMCTGYRAIEFAVRSTIDLPSDHLGFGEKFHLYKCPPIDESSKLRQNFQIYDGTFIIDNIEPDYILSAISIIDIAVNRIAFAYEGNVYWRLKYNTIISERGCATPNEEDLEILQSIFSSFPENEDAEIIDAAIDWFNRGKTTRNIFTAFLCYYIAIERVAIAVAERKASLGFVKSDEKQHEIEKRIAECIRLKYDELFKTEPKKFVTEAYFECIVSLRRKVQRILELVFGQEHKYISLIFNKKNGYSLSDIRSEIAHGGITLLDRESEKLVRERIGELEQISRSFLFRLIFSLKPNDSIPDWSRMHRASLNFDDPRCTLVVSREDILPTKDWRIRPEWCY